MTGFNLLEEIIEEPSYFQNSSNNDNQNLYVPPIIEISTPPLNINNEMVENVNNDSVSEDAPYTAPLNIHIPGYDLPLVSPPANPALVNIRDPELSASMTLESLLNDLLSPPLFAPNETVEVTVDTNPLDGISTPPAPTQGLVTPILNFLFGTDTNGNTNSIDLNNIIKPPTFTIAAEDNMLKRIGLWLLGAFAAYKLLKYFKVL